MHKREKPLEFIHDGHKVEVKPFGEKDYIISVTEEVKRFLFWGKRIKR